MFCVISHVIKYPTLDVNCFAGYMLLACEMMLTMMLVVSGVLIVFFFLCSQFAEHVKMIKL